MRAVTLTELGGVDKIRVQDIPAPESLGPGDVRVRLRAAALNRLDAFVLEGLPGVEYSFPHVLGSDGAGEVAEVGAAVTGWKPGDRVMVNPGISCHACEFCLAGEHSLCIRYRLLGEHLPGTLAEEIVVPAVNLAALPAERSWAEGAAFSLAALTAWRMLVTRARVTPGEWILIWGIGGGVALAALKVAKLLGAVVLVTSSSDAKLERARQLGADYAMNHGGTDVAREVRRLTSKRGVDVVVDNVGEATWAASLKALAKGGRLVTCGGTTGPMVVSDVRRVFWHQYSILGSTMGSVAEYRAVAGQLARGYLIPEIDSEVPLERAPEAFGRLAAGERFGKVVIEI